MTMYQTANDEETLSALQLERRAASGEHHADVLINLARHADPEIRERVAANPYAPRILLHLLSLDEDENVRLSAAENMHIPSSSRSLLLHDQSPDLRYALAENHTLPLGLISQLAQDENPYVAARAQKTLNRLTERQKVRTLASRVHANFRKARSRVTL